MNPFDQPSPIVAPAAPSHGPTSVPSANPELDPVRGAAGHAKQEEPPAAHGAKGIFGIATAESLGKVLTPVLAAAGGVLKPESFLGKKLLNIATGFHVAEGEKAVNKLGPGAVMILGPEPIGVLPEHFFSKKPTIPGTNIYLDPLYNYERYAQRKEDRQRGEAGIAQLEALAPILPTLSGPELTAILNSPDLRREFIGFVPPKQLDAVLLGEIERRRIIAQNDPAALAALQQHFASADRRALEEARQAFIDGDLYTSDAILGYLVNQGRVVVNGPNADVLALPIPLAGGGILVQLIPALTDTAVRQQLSARGINAELVTERIDP